MKLRQGVTVKNIGERAGTETVQLYIRDRYASVSRPLKERKGFKKVELRVGEQKEVTLKININMLKFYRVEPRKLVGTTLHKSP